jgi:hypothetical protein
VERTFSTIKDPVSNDISRRWCRLMGVSAITVFVTCCLVVRNGRVLDAFEAREADDARRSAAGLGPRRRKRRRRGLAELVSAGAGPEAPLPEHPTGVLGPGRRRHGPDVIDLTGAKAWFGAPALLQAVATALPP